MTKPDPSERLRVFLTQEQFRDWWLLCNEMSQGPGWTFGLFCQLARLYDEHTRPEDDGSHGRLFIGSDEYAPSYEPPQTKPNQIEGRLLDMPWIEAWEDFLDISKENLGVQDNELAVHWIVAIALPLTWALLRGRPIFVETRRGLELQIHNPF